MILAISWLTFLGIGQVQAATTVPEFDPYEHVTVEIHPEAPPIPALRYRLMPEAREQIEGNAASEYLMGFGFWRIESSDEIDDLLAAGKLDKVKAAAALERLYTGSFRAAELAGRMDRCDWGLPLRDEGVKLLLPHLNEVRSFSAALALRIRLEIADGKYDEAVADLRTGLTMARHLHVEGVTVDGLVSVGIDIMLLQRVVELQQAPGAPNLYWALANLPRPLVEPRTLVENDRVVFYASFPELRGRRIEELDDSDYRVLFRRMAELDPRFLGSSAYTLPQNRLGSVDSAIAMVSVYQRAKNRLIDQGRSAEQIDRLPVQTVLGSYLLSEYLKWTDELQKWAGVPYWQAREGMLRSRQVVAEQAALRNNPLMQFTFSIDRLSLQCARTQRLEVEASCIDALRAFAASHGGKLPAALDELVDTPVPVNPMTGKPLGYELHGSTATVTSDPIPGEKYPTGKIMQIIVK